MQRFGSLLNTVLLLVLASRPVAAQSITEFPIPSADSAPLGVTAGPDGNLWFTEYSANQIGRITPSGAITEFAIPTADSAPFGITAGPDGNLWFTEYFANQIGRITPAGTITEFPVNFTGAPQDITAGPDGNVWFTKPGTDILGRITPSGTITEFPLPVGNFRAVSGIVAGPDGNLWFAELLGDQIGRITPTGTITEFPLPTTGSHPQGIAPGPDGNLWFTEIAANQIGRITPTGAIAEFAIPTANTLPAAISAGPDGNLWFTETGNLLGHQQIGRITPTGTAIDEFPILTANSLLPQVRAGITAGPDGNIWFTDYGANQIGRITLALPTVVRSAPYDLSDDCNAISSFGDGEAKAQSKADTGGLIVDAKTTKVGNAGSQAGVGINYVAELTGDAKIEAIVRLGIRPTTFDIVCGLSLPKVGKFSIASVESDAFVRATNGAAQEATERFRAAITTPLPGGFSLSPCDLMRYNPPVLLRVSLDASVVQGESYQICAGIRSKVVSVSPFKLLAIAKALYVAEVVQIKVAYK